MWLRLESLVDGTSSPGERGEIRVAGDLVTDGDPGLADVERYANALLELVETARP